MGSLIAPLTGTPASPEFWAAPHQPKGDEVTASVLLLPIVHQHPCGRPEEGNSGALGARDTPPRRPQVPWAASCRVLSSDPTCSASCPSPGPGSLRGGTGVFEPEAESGPHSQAERQRGTRAGSARTHTHTPLLPGKQKLPFAGVSKGRLDPNSAAQLNRNKVDCSWMRRLGSSWCISQLVSSSGGSGGTLPTPQPTPNTHSRGRKRVRKVPGAGQEACSAQQGHNSPE